MRMAWLRSLPPRAKVGLAIVAGVVVIAGIGGAVTNHAKGLSITNPETTTLEPTGTSPTTTTVKPTTTPIASTTTAATTTVPTTTTRAPTTTTTMAPPPPPDCTPDDPCIPPGPDVDCAGGSGNGPRYVTGAVRVTGTDVYGLDRDGDGIGCE